MPNISQTCGRRTCGETSEIQTMEVSAGKVPLLLFPVNNPEHQAYNNNRYHSMTTLTTSRQMYNVGICNHLRVLNATMAYQAKDEMERIDGLSMRRRKYVRCHVRGMRFVGFTMELCFEPWKDQRPNEQMTHTICRVQTKFVAFHLKIASPNNGAFIWMEILSREWCLSENSKGKRRVNVSVACGYLCSLPPKIAPSSSTAKQGGHDLSSQERHHDTNELTESIVCSPPASSTANPDSVIQTFLFDLSGASSTTAEILAIELVTALVLVTKQIKQGRLQYLERAIYRGGIPLEGSREWKGQYWFVTEVQPCRRHVSHDACHTVAASPEVDQKSKVGTTLKLREYEIQEQIGDLKAMRERHIRNVFANEFMGGIPFGDGLCSRE
ncbi:hypothetical protein EDB85DRAFT_1891198 [Lactarius pseudohatsudake]|nr:hypothetical protein EDB85DRAFT_1901413 [Lactarius pseudohatsudake]KAH9031210.1 hypothetical protein EDB85DRAFT_1891198 [Lactarius pseudohatsudake]